MKFKDLNYEKTTIISVTDALIIVDIQNDFIPGGNLAVEGGDEIIDGINELQDIFHSKNARIVLTQDWHPLTHKSFASVHKGKNPFDPHEEQGIGPILWPDHCIQGSKGAEFHPRLNVNHAKAILRKGFNPKIDSYSGFLENDRNTQTGLSGYLKSCNISRIFICGLALDYCVYFTAIDGKKLGFDVYVIPELSRGIDDPENNILTTLEDMEKNGIKFIKTIDIK
ncbi:MAG: bifunctional nicotinamidase/pyrazinamidase [Candidatus Lokiarchaeota archaeon]|nr:bifunctional nicotinamidase/pyrazinamidase [Candidatus Lokiarchaeota archaeon]